MSEERPWETWGQTPAAPAGAGPAETPWTANPTVLPQPQPTPTPETAYRSPLFPVNRDVKGGLHFDPLGSGPIGAIRQAGSLPGRVLSGETPFIAGDPKSTGEAMNMAMTFGSGVNPMVRSGELAVPGAVVHTKFNPRDLTMAKTPSSEKLIESGQNKLDAFEKLPIEYNPKQMFGRIADQTAQTLVDEGIHPHHSPLLYKHLEMLRDNVARSSDPTATLSASPKNFAATREALTKLFEKQGEDRRGISLALGIHDSALANPVKGDVVAGPSFTAAYAPDLYARGRADYSAGKRTGGIEEIRDTADLSAAARDKSPANLYRTRIAAHIADQDAVRGYTEAEQASLLNVPLDTTKGRILRTVGSAMGGGGGPGAVLPASAAGYLANAFGLPQGIAGGVGAATPVIGAALKRAAGENTSELLNKAIDMQKRRSPLFMDMGRQDLVRDIAPGRDAIARQLMRTPELLQGIPTDAPPQALPVLPYDPNRA